MAVLRSKGLSASRWWRLLPAATALWAGALAGPAAAQSTGAQAFERDLLKSRFEQEIRFRAAAIQVAWGAETLCDHTTEIEPFVLWSLHAAGRRPSSAQAALLREATGMDDRWRLAWLDESMPEDVHVGDVVVAINDRPLPAAGTSFSLGNVFTGRSIVSGDDSAFREVIGKARDEAVDRSTMRLRLADGRTVEAPTQTGCAGVVTASAFDPDPGKFWRDGTLRAKIPANALFEARSADEFRWLAAFGVFFQARIEAHDKAQAADSVGNAFTVGRILTALVPGAGMLLSAAEAQAQRSVAVDGIVGRADLFANEVVVALGGDPAAGLAFAKRIRDQGVKADVFELGDFRLSSMEEHVRRLRELQKASAP